MSTWRRLHDHPDLWPRYFVREKVLTAIRRFFLDREFHEVETPYLTGSLPPESYLEIFETTLLNRKREAKRAFLPTSPEPFIKKLLVAGVGNCFALPKSFRNTETTSLTHNPEFTILEWYRVNADYTDIMDDCEELVSFINTYLQRTNDKEKSAKPTELVYQKKHISLASPWERLTMCDAFKKYSGIDLPHALTRVEFAPLAKKKGYTVTEDDTWEELFHQVFFNEIEPYLGKGRPTILYDYPVELAALSRKKKSDPRFAERFEFYIEGLELGDAYSELTDAEEQLARFKDEEAERKRLGKITHPIDMDFIEALRVGMPTAGGIAVGVDRLIMLFADVVDIADTLFFPAGDLFDK
jgi:elongation factor P--(R)-beta-lysine ligase